METEVSRRQVVDATESFLKLVVSLYTTEGRLGMAMINAFTSAV